MSPFLIACNHASWTCTPHRELCQVELRAPSPLLTPCTHMRPAQAVLDLTAIQNPSCWQSAPTTGRSRSGTSPRSSCAHSPPAHPPARLLPGHALCMGSPCRALLLAPGFLLASVVCLLHVNVVVMLCSDRTAPQQLQQGSQVSGGTCGERCLPPQVPAQRWHVSLRVATKMGWV